MAHKSINQWQRMVHKLAKQTHMRESIRFANLMGTGEPCRL